MLNREFSKLDLDILGELGNIGSGNAATALSELLNQKVIFDTHSASKCNLADIPDFLGGAEKIQTGVVLKVSHAINGYILFLIDDDKIETLTDNFTREYKKAENKQVLLEISNIMAGAYVGALANLLNSTIDLKPPELAHDMLGALVDGIVSKILCIANKTVIIRTKLLISDRTISCNLVFLLEYDSLNSLLKYFNQEE